ncbi:MAG: type II/IV secretion system ATPase subunit [Candidatus Aenigmatarchaeota archaeon]
MNPQKTEQQFVIRKKHIKILQIPITKDFNEALNKFPHLREYVNKISVRIGMPEWLTELDRRLREREVFNILYPVGDPIFINIYKVPGEEISYVAIEPKLTDRERNLLEKIQSKIVKLALESIHYEDIEKIKETIENLYDKVVTINKSSLFSGKISLRNKEEYEKLKYFLIRERLGFGKLEPLIRDPYIEDVHTLGVGPVWIVHKIFGTIKTNIEFINEEELNKYVIRYSEIVERPVSEARPISDAILPDGSRVNFIYGKDISLHGSSFTIRKFTAKPISITQLISFGTISPEEAAYLWLAIEHGMNVFVIGETASGKTTTLNAITTFIRPDWKVYSVEDTPELNIPHEIWQRLVTRQHGKRTDIEMYDLLRAALRSRPNYILVGEIRGKEGFVAFQAMQTGHPVMSTFHAGSLNQLIERLTGEPINIPITFIDNLNIVVLQGTVYIKGKMERRVLKIYEIERYIHELKRIAAREVFVWDRINDKHVFRGKYNSYVLEYKIAPLLRLPDRRKIYDILEERAKILKRMVEEEIFDFFEVWEVIKKFYSEGKKGLPFVV